MADKKHTAGFYANVIFTGTPAMVTQLQHKFALNEEVFRVLFTAVAGAETREIIPIPYAMASFNKVILIGNLTRDPELRYTPKGTAIAKLGLAVNRVWTSEAGEKKEEVTFVDVDVFGRTAENIGQYMEKGRPILIEGRLQARISGTTNRPARRKASSASCWKTFQFLGLRRRPRRRRRADAPASASGGRVRARRRRTRRRRRPARRRRRSILILPY